MPVPNSVWQETIIITIGRSKQLTEVRIMHITTNLMTRILKTPLLKRKSQSTKYYA